MGARSLYDRVTHLHALTGRERSWNDFGDRLAGFHRGHEKAADRLSASVDIHLGAAHHSLIVAAGDDHESPLIVGILDLALEFSTDDAGLLIDTQGGKFGGDLLKTVALDLRRGNGTFELSHLDFGLLDLGANLDHLLLNGLHGGDIAPECLGLFKVRLGRFKIRLLGFLVGFGFDDFGVEIDLGRLKGRCLIGQRLNGLLQPRDFRGGLVKRDGKFCDLLLLGFDIELLLLENTHVVEAQVECSTEDD